jgi:hypothetical protein
MLNSRLNRIRTFCLPAASLQAGRLRSSQVSKQFLTFLFVLLISATVFAADDEKDLRKAAEKCDKAKVDRLLAKGADVNAVGDKGVTALMLAAGKGCAEVVQALLDADADAEAKDKNGLTAAMLAERNGFADIVKLLNRPRPKVTEGNANEIPCSSIKMKSGEKSKQERFFAASEKRVREVVIDAMMAIGFVVKKEKGQKLEAFRRYPELGGRGKGGETLKFNFETVEQSGSSATRVTGETKQGLIGLYRHNWTDAVLDQAECLLTLFGPRTNEEILAENTAQPNDTAEQAIQPITLPDGVPIKLRIRRYLLAKDAKKDFKEGKRIVFQVTDDVMVDGKVVIKKGALGWGRVTDAKDIGFVGRNAKLNFVIESVMAMDGQNIPVRSTANNAGGGGTSGSNIALNYLGGGVFGAIFSQGKQVGIRAGTEFIVFSNGDQSLKLKTTPE